VRHAHRGGALLREKGRAELTRCGTDGFQARRIKITAHSCQPWSQALSRTEKLSHAAAKKSSGDEQARS
jgi:hypothetical protein